MINHAISRLILLQCNLKTKADNFDEAAPDLFLIVRNLSFNKKYKLCQQNKQYCSFQ